MKVLKVLLAGLVSIVLVLSLILAVSPYLRRCLFLQAPSVYDYDELPNKTIEKSVKPFHFDTADMTIDFDSLGMKYNNKEVGDMQSFLESHGTTAFIIIRDGKIFYEKYLNGHSRDSYCKAFSMTKSVLSFLIGIAIDEGLITDVNDKIMKYIPEFKGQYAEQLTLLHCLNYQTGLHYTKGKTPWSDRTRMLYTTNVRKLLLGVKFIEEPGASFSSHEYANLIAAFSLERAIGTTITEYLQNKLFDKIGMEYSALINIDSHKHGFEKMESGLTARAIDFAKIGRLVLTKGLWKGEQVVPKQWIKSLFVPAEGNKWDHYIKYMWWGAKRDTGIHDVYANGHFGQRIYVSPTANMVVVRMGYKTGGISWARFIRTLVDRIMSHPEQSKLQ